MNLNSLGSVVSGQGAAGVWRDNFLLVLPPAGKPACLTDERIIYQNQFNQIEVREADGRTSVVSEQGATWICANGGHWAAFLADGKSGVRTSFGLHLPDAALLGLKGGVLFVKTSYQTGGIRAYTVGETSPRWSLPSAQPDIRNDVPQFSALDGDRVLWSENGMLRARNLPAPAQIGAAFDPFLLEPTLGDVLLGYHSDRFYLHRLTDASRGCVVATGETFGTIGLVIVDTIGGAHARG